MTKEKQSGVRAPVSVKDLLGKQVIDNKGSLLGVLKDLRLSCGRQETIVLVELKTGEKVKIPWLDVQSVEDFVLLKKSARLTTETKKEVEERVETAKAEITEPTLVTKREITCTSCGEKVPSYAKFCRNCGKKIVK